MDIDYFIDCCLRDNKCFVPSRQCSKCKEPFGYLITTDKEIFFDPNCMCILNHVEPIKKCSREEFEKFVNVFIEKLIF